MTLALAGVRLTPQFHPSNPHCTSNRRGRGIEMQTGIWVAIEVQIGTPLAGIMKLRRKLTRRILLAFGEPDLDFQRALRPTIQT